MDFNHNFDYKIFDYLIDNNIRFAIYRLPGQQDISLILQKSPISVQPDTLSELNAKTGFVIAPFHISPETPISLIRPEVVIKGERSVFEYLSNTSFSNYAISIDIHSQSYIDTFENYKLKFDTFHTALTSNKFQKLVQSRTLDKKRDSDFSAGESFKRACLRYPLNFVFLCNTPQTEAWMGISPELLLSEKNSDCQTVALAGTKNSAENWDDKNRREQQIVVDYMKQQLDKFGVDFTQGDPDTIQSGNIEHLKTAYSFRLPDKNLIGDLLQLLHPSPAVCGFPKEEAFDFIQKNEGYDRRYYSGFVGPLYVEDKSDLYVNLRCMQIGNDTLRLYAGGGLLSSSDVISEWKETESKLQTILSIINE